MHLAHYRQCVYSKVFLLAGPATEEIVMKSWILLSIILICCAVAGTDAAISRENEQPEYVSIVQLVATPERFDGKLLVVTGFLSLGTEADELYISSSDEANGILENGISIVRTQEIQQKRAELNQKYVRVAGRFKLNNRLKARFTSGGFAEVESCQFWSDPQHPIREKLKHFYS